MFSSRFKRALFTTYIKQNNKRTKRKMVNKINPNKKIVSQNGKKKINRIY